MSLFIHSDAAPVAMREAFPLKCMACEGWGDQRGEPLCPPGCSCGGRYHGYDDAECEDCGGRGVIPCDVCGIGHDAAGIDQDGDKVCANCLEAEKDELAREAELRRQLRVS